jgi:hemerythrin-like domain-containing protein
MNSTIGPLKRNASLRQLSRDHHSGLLLCWKIRTGLDKNVEPERIKKYCDNFFSTHLEPHFLLEEQVLYPLLGSEAVIKRALSEHDHLRHLFKNGEGVAALKEISLKLNEHIRFEERDIFKLLQELVPEEQLAEIMNLHDERTAEPEWHDRFWE